MIWGSSNDYRIKRRMFFPKSLYMLACEYDGKQPETEIQVLFWEKVATNQLLLKHLPLRLYVPAAQDDHTLGVLRDH